jgi:hypothetical protein
MSESAILPSIQGILDPSFSKCTTLHLQSMVEPTSNSSGNGTSSGNGIVPQPLSNASNFSISELLSQADRDAVMSLITQMHDKLPLLRDLAAQERKTLLGMGDKNRIFAGKVLEVVLQHPDFLPRSFDTEQLQQDLATFDHLSTILMALNQLRDLVDATTIAIGTEAFESALTAYRHAKASGQGASLEAMMAEMSQRFARKSKKKEGTKPEAIK